jgi:hypothetical protein
MRMTTMRLLAILIGFSILTLSLGAVAVSFDITVVEASKEGSGFDPGLNAYKKQLSEMGYRSGKEISSTGFNSDIGKNRTFKVAGNISAEITPTAVNNGFINFDFKMTQGGNEIVKLSYKIPNGKHTIIVGPSSKKNKYVIIIRASE